MVGGVHLVGLVLAVLLIMPALRDGTEPPRPPSEGSDGGGGLRRHVPRQPVRPRGGIPLPDAEPSRIRLREPGHLADLLPRPARRPAREPDRRPVRV